MALLKFELTEKHIAIAKVLDWITIFKMANNVEMEDGVNIFGGYDFYEDMGLAIYGKVGDFDPTTDSGPTFTKEQKTEMDKILEEMPQALQIMMMTGKFEVGTYTTKHYDINWKKKK